MRDYKLKLLALRQKSKHLVFLDILQYYKERLDQYLIVFLINKNRNEIAYEYSFDQNEVVDSINVIYNITEDIIKIYDNFYQHCINKLTFVRDSVILK
jgi:hypothetical protein